MTRRVLSPEEQADRILERDARRRKLSLRQLGILDRNRLAIVSRVETPVSVFEQRRAEREESSEE